MTDGRFVDQLSPAIREMLGAVELAAGAIGVRAYLVGGVVRDLLLGAPPVDLDIVVIGDASAVTRLVARETSALLTLHEPFNTAALTWPDGTRLDVTSARREVYPSPGALPVVTPGDLDDDLRRRDFTVNAMAIALGEGPLGPVIDPLRGMPDLEQGLIRVIHRASFQDDPTRLLRAVRYEQRLSALVRPGGRRFVLEAETERAATDAVASDALSTVSVERRVAEFRRLVLEPSACAMLDRLAALRLLRAVHPALTWDAERRRACACLTTALGWTESDDEGIWAARFGLLARDVALATVEALTREMRLSAYTANVLRQVAGARSGVARIATRQSDAQLGALLAGYSPVALAVTAAIEPVTREAIDHYLRRVRPIRPLLSGNYLRARGVAPGPVYREALRALLDFKRDAPEASLPEEQAFVEAWLQEHHASPERAMPGSA